MHWSASARSVPVQDMPRAGQRRQLPLAKLDDARTPAGLEPGMVAAVDLDHFADTGATVARLVDLGRTPLARRPQAHGRHEASDRLHAKHQPMTFPEQRRLWPRQMEG